MFNMKRWRALFPIIMWISLCMPAFQISAAELVLPVEEEFMKGSILHMGGGPTGSLLYEGLVTKNDRGGYDGWLARSWKSFEDARIWEFKLITGATWHDGAPFTSHDVKFTYDFLKEKQLWLGSVLWMVERVECSDDETVIFHLKRSFPKFLDHLSHCPGIAIIPMHIWKGIENPMRYEDRQYIGTGPFQFDQKIPGQFFAIKAYADYHGRQPAFSKVILRCLKSADARVLALKSGEIDALGSLTPWMAAALSKGNNIKLAVFPKKRLYELCFNCTLYPTSSPIMRKALACAVDRTKICKVIFQNQAQPANSWLMPKFASNGIQKHLYSSTGNLDDAVNLLKKGGFRLKKGRLLDKRGQEVHLTLLLGGKGTADINTKMAEVLAQELKLLGITVELKQVDSSVWFKEARANHLFIMAMPDLMHDDPDDLTHFRSGSFFGKPNWHGYSNPEYDRLSAELHETTETKRRQALASAMQDLLISDVPTTAICEANELIAFRSDKIAWKQTASSMYGKILDLRTLLDLEPVPGN